MLGATSREGGREERREFCASLPFSLPPWAVYCTVLYRRQHTVHAFSMQIREYIRYVLLSSQPLLYYTVIHSTMYTRRMSQIVKKVDVRTFFKNIPLHFCILCMFDFFLYPHPFFLFLLPPPISTYPSSWSCYIAGFFINSVHFHLNHLFSSSSSSSSFPPTIAIAHTHCFLECSPQK